MNKGTKGNNQTAKETKETLTNQLAKVGLDRDTTFKPAKSSYNTMTSKKRIKGDLNHWRNIGCFVDDAREAMTLKNINVNTGYLSDIRRIYFPELTPQDFSNARWLFNHYPVVLEWIEKNRRSLSNPASIKQAIRKQLTTDKADNSEFTKFELDPPKPSNPNPPDGKDKKDKGKKTNVTLDDNLNNLELIINQFDKISTKNWSMDQFKRFENLVKRVDDFYQDLDEKLQKAKIVKVNDNIHKKPLNQKTG